MVTSLHQSAPVANWCRLAPTSPHHSAPLDASRHRSAPVGTCCQLVPTGVQSAPVGTSRHQAAPGGTSRHQSAPVGT
eukprot:14749731-Alexandrium_andersonii.AAC.1